MSLAWNVLWASVATVICHPASAEVSVGWQTVERPQYSYKEYEVAFRNEPDGIKLTGTLVIPDSAKPAAACILIPNSSLDRDATAGRHRPFQVLAAHLARNGVITLRADSRVLCSQIRHVAAAFGIAESTIERHIQLIQQSATVLVEHSDEGEAREKLRSLYNDYLLRTTEAERSALTKCGYTARENSEDFAAGVLLPWMKDFLLYDPRPDLRHIQCPVLFLIGEKDMLVAADENSDTIREAFERGGDGNVVLATLSGLNHLLQEAPTGSPIEYQEIAEAISPSVLEIIGQWIST